MNLSQVFSSGASQVCQYHTPFLPTKSLFITKKTEMNSWEFGDHLGLIVFTPKRNNFIDLWQREVWLSNVLNNHQFIQDQGGHLDFREGELGTNGLDDYDAYLKFVSSLHVLLNSVF